MAQAITTSGAILAVKYDNGILLASDKTISYGSMFKYNNVSHFEQLTSSIIMGASGEFADFQELKDIIKSVILKEKCKHGGAELSPSEVHNYVKRLMYQRRSKMNPIVAKVVIAGINPDQSLFLACTDLYGASWEDDVISTGMGKYLQGDQLRNAVNGTKEEVQKSILEVFQAIYSRFAQANGKLEFIDMSKDGKIERTEGVEVMPNWEIVEGTWDQ